MNAQTSGGPERRFLLALDAIMRGIDADEVRFNYDDEAAPIAVRLAPMASTPVPRASIAGSHR